MKLSLPRSALAATMLAAALSLGQAADKKPYEEARWEQLVPRDWDPAKVLAGTDLANLSDSDPRAAELMRRVREAWDQAPAEPAMDGRRIRIAGYVVPLEHSKAGMREFLLVPYFGACIHTPPPPANQIVHVALDKPAKDIRSMEAVWVAGTLRTTRVASAMGVSGYRMESDAVEPYARSK